MDRTLLAVPNISSGSPQVARRLASVFETPCTRVLDLHSDDDHGRSVISAAGRPLGLVEGIVALAAAAAAAIDVLATSSGQHPHIGSLDVAPFVYANIDDRGAACAAALTAAQQIGELGIPVFLYGELTADAERPARTRAELRSGGVSRLAERISAGDLTPDFGPAAIHSRAGAVLVAAREPLVAFNLVLADADLTRAREIASLVREGGGQGIGGLKAIGVLLSDGRAQVSMNVERPSEVSLAQVVERVDSLASVQSAEIVGLVPAAALESFPVDLPIEGFDPARQVLEKALGSC